MLMLNSRTSTYKYYMQMSKFYSLTMKMIDFILRLFRDRLNANAHRLQEYAHGCVTQSFVDCI